MEHLLFTYWLAWMFQVESPQMIWARSVCYFIFCLKVTYWKYLTLKYVLSEMLRILFSRHSINRIYCHESSLAALFGLLMSWSNCSYRSRFLPLVIVASRGHTSHHKLWFITAEKHIYNKIYLKNLDYFWIVNYTVYLRIIGQKLWLIILWFW